MTGSSATLSACRRYRYVLIRCWDESLPQLIAIGLNPSKADESTNDNTVRKLIVLAKRWGYGRLVLLNLFAWRSTDRSAIATAPDPVGPENDAALERYCTPGRKVLVAWGNDGWRLARDQKVLHRLQAIGCDVWSLGVTKEGRPKHCLYLANDTPLRPWEWTT